MAMTPASNARSRTNITKASTQIGCIFFVIAVALSPGPDSSIGMPSTVFYCTWSVSFIFAAFAFVAFFMCALLGDRISLFYAVCPFLLIVGFLLFYYLSDITQAILEYELGG